jgi:hypothetical protein
VNEMRQGRRAKAGDVVAISGHRVGEAPRSGEILEVLCEPGQQHFRVRWQDGHESIFYPSSDTVVRAARAGGKRTS